MLHAIFHKYLHNHGRHNDVLNVSLDVFDVMHGVANKFFLYRDIVIHKFHLLGERYVRFTHQFEIVSNEFRYLHESVVIVIMFAYLLVEHIKHEMRRDALSCILESEVDDA